MKNERVLIIGAGAAGLAAAHRLAQHALPATILEGRDRVGGRIWTIRDHDLPTALEAGAEFIHGKADPIQVAVRELGLSADEVPDRHWQVEAGQQSPLNIEPAWSEVTKRLNGLTTDLSFADFLRRDCPDLSDNEQTRVKAYVEGFNAADAEVVSAAWVRDSDEASGQAEGARRIRSGYDRLLDYFLQPHEALALDVRLGQRVKTIRWRPGSVEVDATDRIDTKTSYHARAAVVTLPVGVLQATPSNPAAIQFVPDLVAKRSVWDLLPMGNVIKVAVQFDKPFWMTRGHVGGAFFHTPNAPFMVWWTAQQGELPILTGWSGGPRTSLLRRLLPPAVRDEAVQTLADAFKIPRIELTRRLKRLMIFDWQADCFSRGAYAYVPVHGMALPEQLAIPVDDTLFFAGEATHVQLMGTVTGAIESGIRAANEVLKSLG